MLLQKNEKKTVTITAALVIVGFIIFGFIKFKSNEESTFLKKNNTTGQTIETAALNKNGVVKDLVISALWRLSFISM